MGYHNQSIKLVTKFFRRSNSKKSKKNAKKSNVKSESLGGVYLVTDDPLLGHSSVPTIGGPLNTIKEQPPAGSKSLEDSFRSLSTADTTSHESLDSEATTNTWVSSGSPQHEEGAPLLVRRAVSSRNLMIGTTDLSDEEVMGRVMLKARKLPKANKYLVSNHVMINTERTKRTRVPLKRNPKLDKVAQHHAKEMAASNKLYHPNLEHLPTGSCTRLGANVGCGGDIRDIHTSMVQASQSDLNNIIDRRFVYMGVGTAKGTDGKMYLCQIFGD